MNINSKTIPAILLAGVLTFSPVSIKIEKEGSKKFVRIEQMSAYANEGIKVNLNGSELSFDQEPKLVNGRTFVPIRAIFEGLGASVSYDEATSIVTSLTEEGVVVKHQIGTNIISMNDATKDFDASSVVENGRTLVPVRLIAESLGAEVNWDDTTKTVIIEKDRLNEQGLYFDPYNEEEVNNILNSHLLNYSKYIGDGNVYDRNMLSSYGKSAIIFSNAKEKSEINNNESGKQELLDIASYVFGSAFYIESNLLCDQITGNSDEELQTPDYKLGYINKEKAKLFANPKDRAFISTLCKDISDYISVVYKYPNYDVNILRDKYYSFYKKYAKVLYNSEKVDTYLGKLGYADLGDGAKLCATSIIAGELVFMDTRFPEFKNVNPEEYKLFGQNDWYSAVQNVINNQIFEDNKVLTK